MYNNIYLNENTNSTFKPFAKSDNIGNFSAPQKDNSIKPAADSFDKSNQKEQKINSLIKMGTTATLLGIIFTAIIRGHSQSISKKIQSIFGGVESKFAHIKDKHLHKILITTFGLFERTAKIITNSSPIKDYLLHQALGKTSITRKLRKSIATIFTKQNKNTAQKSFTKSRESYIEFINSVEDAVKKSKSNPALVKNNNKFEHIQKLLQDAKRKLEDNPQSFLSDKHFKSAVEIMGEDMKFLDQETSVKRFFSKEVFQGFIPENILLERRAEFIQKLLKNKNAISCSIEDLSKYAADRINDTNLLIYSIKDAKLQQRLRNWTLRLEDSLKDILKPSKQEKSLVEKTNLVKRNISDLKKEIELLAKSETKDHLKIHIKAYEDLFEESQPGIVQEIRILAGYIWGDKSEIDKNIKKAALQHSKDLNLSLNKTINMFDKQRDITLGSGAVDILQTIIPTVAFGVALNQADSKEKKISTSLELGIPLVGGLLVYFWTLSRQFNGVRALTTSLGAMAALNLAGSSMYKKYIAMQGPNKKEIASIPQQL